MEPNSQQMGFVILLLHLVFFYLPLICIVSLPLFLFNKLYKMNINVKKWTLYILLSVLFVDILLIIFFHETIRTIISGSTTIKT